MTNFFILLLYHTFTKTIVLNGDTGTDRSLLMSKSSDYQEGKCRFWNGRRTIQFNLKQKTADQKHYRMVCGSYDMYYSILFLRLFFSCNHFFKKKKPRTDEMIRPLVVTNTATHSYKV